MTGDYSYLDLPRSQFDLIWSLRKEEDGVTKVPHRHFDAGWADYRLPSARHMIYIWTTSMAQEDLDRIMALPRDNNWDAVYIPGVSGGEKGPGRDTQTRCHGSNLYMDICQIIRWRFSRPTLS
jgi:hypothetical protein